MDYKGLHYAGIAFDILYCIWFVLMLLLNCFAEGLSGMDHSSDSVLHAYERQCNFISYSAGLIGNIIGFFMLLNMSVYYYYQLIVKCIVMALFLIFFAIFKVSKDWCSITIRVMEGVYAVVLILHVLEFVYHN